MPDDMKVSVSIPPNAEQLFADSKSEGSSAATTLMLMAEVSIVIPDIDLPKSEFPRVKDELQSFNQELADKVFGKGNVVVSVQLISGSITVIISILLGGYGAIKDYPKFKVGLKQFVDDVKKASGTIRSKLWKPKPPQR
jgi:hypothetical protein